MSPRDDLSDSVLVFRCQDQLQIRSPDRHGQSELAYLKAQQIMLNTPFGVALTKEGMWAALEIPGMQVAIDLENRQQIMASNTLDHREALRAFLEKRPPHYTWG